MSSRPASRCTAFLVSVAVLADCVAKEHCQEQVVASHGSLVSFLQTKSHIEDVANVRTAGRAWVLEDPRLSTSLAMQACLGEGEDLSGTVNGYSSGVNDFFVAELTEKGLLASSPEDAELFIVPFDIDTSFSRGDCVTSSGQNSTHEQRMNAALDALEASVSFVSSGGRDHIWITTLGTMFLQAQMETALFGGAADYFPLSRRFLLKNMTVGRYIDSHIYTDDNKYGTQSSFLFAANLYVGHVADWRCTVLVPIMTQPDLAVKEEPFEKWMQRPINFFYRGNPDGGCRHNVYIGHTMSYPNHLRGFTHDLKKVLPDSVFEDGHADSVEEYINEISTSRFCLVMRCDNPQTSRFMEAVAAGCIPVIISTGFEQVAEPFTSDVNYGAWAVNIPEAWWEAGPEAALHYWVSNIPEGRLHKMHAALLEQRQALLWRHPQSAVAQLVLKTASEECPP